MGLEDAARRAAEAILARPKTTRWLLACDVDADGLAAAAVMAQALRRAGHRFTLRASRDKDEAGYRTLLADSWDGLILLDKGSSHLAFLASHASGRPVLVVDHHNVKLPPPEGITLLNPRAEGLDGSQDASGSTTAAALALALCGEAALAWAPTALVGAVGDWQDGGGWRGWNLELCRRARQAGHLASTPRPRLVGPDLAVAITRIHPTLPGLSNVEAARSLLGGIGLEGEDPEDLDAEACTRLVSSLLLKCLAAGEPPEDPRTLLEDVDLHVPLGVTLRKAYLVADACGREGKTATGIAYLMGDKGARTEALSCLAAYRTTLDQALQALAGNLEAHGAVHVGWTDRAAYTGLVAGHAMEGFGPTGTPPDTRRPLCIMAIRPDGRVQASTRGTHAQVASGLDLGRACAEAAAAVGSEGGGHPVAAGAVMGADHAGEFVARLDQALLAQGFLEAA